MKTVLNLGCALEPLPEWYPAEEWREIRVDGDPLVEADITADIRAVPLDDGCADAIYCSHVLEHVAELDLPVTLMEFRRLLADDGELVVSVPDIQRAAQWIVDGRENEAMFTAAAGNIRPLDVIYGWAMEMKARPLMGHRTGFTSRSLSWWLSQAGFKGEMTRDDYISLIARVRKNGRAPLAEAMAGNPGRGLIMVQQREQ